MINGTEYNKKQKAYIEQIIREYADIIYRLAYQYTGNFSDAQDVLQEVCLALVISDAPIDDKEHLKAWLCRVSINKCKNLYKRKKIIQWQELKEDTAVYESEIPYLKDELFKLPPKYRTVLYLHYYEEYSIKEISEILQVNINTVGARLRRGREKLKILLTEGE
ncbi:MAG: RNA polymerase sigma factor [Ruminococcus sp.]|nr:RNA polymerase sigma factor [Ruminococcus sp.]